MSGLLKYFPHIDIVGLENTDNSDSKKFNIDSETLNRIALLSNDPISFIKEYSLTDPNLANKAIFSLCKIFNRIPNKNIDFESEHAHNCSFDVVQLLDYLNGINCNEKFPSNIIEIRRGLDFCEKIVQNSYVYEDMLIQKIIFDAEEFNQILKRLRIQYFNQLIGFQQICFCINQYSQRIFFMCELLQLKTNISFDTSFDNALNCETSKEMLHTYEGVISIKLAEDILIRGKMTKLLEISLIKMRTSKHSEYLDRLRSTIEFLRNLDVKIDDTSALSMCRLSLQDCVYQLDILAFTELQKKFNLLSIIKFCLEKCLFWVDTTSENNYVYLSRSKTNISLKKKMSSLFSQECINDDHSLTTNDSSEYDFIKFEIDENLKYIFNETIVDKYNLLYRFLHKVEVCLEILKFRLFNSGNRNECATIHRIISILTSFLFYQKNICINRDYSLFISFYPEVQTLHDLNQQHEIFIDKCLKNSLLTNYKLFVLFDNYINSSLKLCSLESENIDANILTMISRNEKNFIEGLRYYSIRNYEHRLCDLLHYVEVEQI